MNSIKTIMVKESVLLFLIIITPAKTQICHLPELRKKSIMTLPHISVDSTCGR